MDPATLSLIGLGISAAGTAGSLLGPKPKKPDMPQPQQQPIPDSNPSQSTSFLSNAAVAPSSGQTSGKTLLGQ